MHIQRQKLVKSTGCVSRIALSKTFMNPFMNPSHHSSHHKTHVHPHTNTRYHTAQSYINAHAGLAAITGAASCRKSAWHIPSPACQQRVYYHGRWQPRAVSNTFSQRQLRLLCTIKIKIHSSCEMEYFVETHLCKLCVILRSRVLRVVCPHQGYRSATSLATTV